MTREALLSESVSDGILFGNGFIRAIMVLGPPPELKETCKARYSKVNMHDHGK